MSENSIKATLERRRSRSKKKLSNSTLPRICVFRSSKHTYAQLVDALNGEVILATSTTEKEVQEKIKKIETKEGWHSKANSTKSTHAARCIGLILAENCKQKKIERVVFDRNGNIYQGRVQAVADGAREGGLQF